MNGEGRDEKEKERRTERERKGGVEKIEEDSQFRNAVLPAVWIYLFPPPGRLLLVHLDEQVEILYQVQPNSLR